MKKLIFNISNAVFAIVFITVLGIDEIKTNRVGLAIVSFLLAATNIPVIFLHWYQYKHGKTLDDSKRIC